MALKLTEEQIKSLVVGNYIIRCHGKHSSVDYENGTISQTILTCYPDNKDSTIWTCHFIKFYYNDKIMNEPDKENNVKSFDDVVEYLKYINGKFSIAIKKFIKKTKLENLSLDFTTD